MSRPEDARPDEPGARDANRYSDDPAGPGPRAAQSRARAGDVRLLPVLRSHAVHLPVPARPSVAPVPSAGPPEGAQSPPGGSAGGDTAI